MERSESPYSTIECPKIGLGNFGPKTSENIFFQQFKRLSQGD